MGEKYPEAARRHLEDSKYLLDDERWDNSAYLAGYVIECSIKALITTPYAPDGVDVYKIGHDIQTLAGHLVPRPPVFPPLANLTFRSPPAGPSTPCQ